MKDIDKIVDIRIWIRDLRIRIGENINELEMSEIELQISLYMNYISKIEVELRF